MQAAKIKSRITKEIAIPMTPPGITSYLTPSVEERTRNRA